jgi:hypothetical protein
MGKSIYDLFATDTNMETAGRWYRIGDMEFLLARAGGTNTKFTAAYAASSRPYQRQQQMGQLSEDTAREILAEPFSKHVVLDWRTRAKDDKGAEVITDHVIPGKDGPLTYSVKAAQQLLMDIPDLLMTLVEAAGNFSNYAPADLEAAAKN